MKTAMPTTIIAVMLRHRANTSASGEQRPHLVVVPTDVRLVVAGEHRGGDDGRERAHRVRTAGRAPRIGGQLHRRRQHEEAAARGERDHGEADDGDEQVDDVVEPVHGCAISGVGAALGAAAPLVGGHGHRAADDDGHQQPELHRHADRQHRQDAGDDHARRRPGSLLAIGMSTATSASDAARSSPHDVGASPPSTMPAIRRHLPDHPVHRRRRRRSSRTGRGCPGSVSSANARVNSAKPRSPFR